MSRPRYLIYADDDIDDLFIFREAVAMLDSIMTIREARNGFEVLALLEEALEQQHLPCLVVLDLNMPGMNGKETVKAIKSDVRLKQVTLVIFTTSSSKIDLEFCASHGVECMVKPLNFGDLMDAVKKFIAFCPPVS